MTKNLRFIFFLNSKVKTKDLLNILGLALSVKSFSKKYRFLLYFLNLDEGALKPES